MKKQHPLISLCMIVGNVEEYIERCLTSFYPIADEICVVRAIGNQEPDRTLEIARDKFGARVAEYKNKSGNKDWPHVDDFAAARQQSFDMAQGKYCFWCDSDDILKSGAEIVREIAERGEYPLGIFPYEIFGRGVTVPRERLILRTAPGRWKFQVHESFQFDMKIEAVSDDRVVVQHLPKPTKEGSVDRNLRILESIPKEERTAGLKFHLHQELKACGRINDAIEIAKDALASPDIGTPEKYELLCDLARMCNNPATAGAYLIQAYAADPCRREALGMLASTAIDLGRPKDALAYGRQMMATLRPEVWSWNDRQAAYGWLGYDVYQQVLRANGMHDDAETVRKHCLAQSDGVRISLLHATRGRPKKAAIARKMWLDLAENPDRIEHIFAIDSDDDESFALRRFHHLIIPSGGGCVAAWNRAALQSEGELMIQMSDDWIPPAKWDTLLLERIDDISKPRVIAVSDGHRTDQLLCMAICTRAYWAQDYFLFHPWFTGVFSDNHFTDQAYKRNQVIEARDLVFTHEHPIFTGKEMDATYMAQNASDRYAHGVQVMEILKNGSDWSTIPGWFNFWELYQIIARRLKDGDKVAEVGVWMGRSLAFLAQECRSLGKNISFTAVDSFRGEKGQEVHYNAVSENGGSIREQFDANMERCCPNDDISVIEGDSAESAKYIADKSLSFCFIDAAHDYESVKRDIAAWFPKIKNGGIIAGHDYQHEDVRRAVQDLLPGAINFMPCWMFEVK